jgi:uncharacterized protein (DUF2236 family)
MQIVGSEELAERLARVRALARDPCAGLFGPRSDVWEVNKESISLLGGERAALPQLAHPWVARGIEQHSSTPTIRSAASSARSSTSS